MRLLTSLLLPCLFVTSVQASEEAKTEKTEYVFDCRSGREFITTYEFLRKRTEFGLNPPEMREMALSVAGGCTDAAANFISITELLLKARLDARTALTSARDVALKGKTASTAYIDIFKQAFAQDAFDLNAILANQLASRLTVSYKGDPKIAAEDFKDMARFCVSATGAGLTRPACANIVEHVIVANQEAKMSIAKPFLKIFEFLTDRKEVNLTPVDAVNIAEKLVAASPEAIGSFRKVYEYGIDASGLALPRPEALKMALDVAVKTKQVKSTY